MTNKNHQTFSSKDKNINILFRYDFDSANAKVVKQITDFSVKI